MEIVKFKDLVTSLQLEESLQNSVLKRLEYSVNLLVTTIERIPIPILIGLILSAVYLSFIPDENEEQYMLLAKQFMNPNWIKNSDGIEFPGVRLLYQFIIGTLLSYVNFESVLFSMRLLMIVSLSIVLSKLYERFQLDNTQIFTHLALLFIGHQSLFAGSWMFVSVEAKGFAWILILLSIYYILSKRLYLSLILMIAGSYFHFLEGFYSFCFIAVTIYFNKNKLGYSNKELIIMSVMYITAILPMVLYLTPATQQSASNLSPSTNWIYSYFRHPHHAALYPDFTYFLHKHLFGILLTFIGLIFSIVAFINEKIFEIKFSKSFVISSSAITILLVSVSFLDRDGGILKFYLYRINTLTTFILTMLIMVWIWRLIKEEYKPQTKAILIMLSTVSLFNLSLTNAHTYKKYFFSKDEVADICSYIKSNTAENDEIISFIDDLSVSRKAERELFSVYKFVPAEMNKIHNWYFRVMEQRKAKADLNYLDILAVKYGVNHVLIDKDEKLPSTFEIKYQNSKYAFYKRMTSN